MNLIKVTPIMILVMSIVSINAAARTVQYRCPPASSLSYASQGGNQWFVSADAIAVGINPPRLGMLGKARSTRSVRLVSSETFATDGYNEFVCSYAYSDDLYGNAAFYIAERALTHVLDHCKFSVDEYLPCNELGQQCVMTCEIEG